MVKRTASAAVPVGSGGTGAGLVASARHLAIITPGGPVFPCDAPPGFFAVIGVAGTSQAAPHVAGLAAQLVGKLGRNHPSAVVQAILRGADDLGAPGADDAYGRGRINVPASLGH